MLAGVGQLQCHRHHVAYPGHHAVLGFVFREDVCPDRVGYHIENQRLAVGYQTLGHGGGGGAKGVDVVVFGQFRQHLLAQHGCQRRTILIGVIGGDGGLIAKAGQLCPKARFGCGFTAPQHHGDREGVSGKSQQQQQDERQPDHDHLSGDTSTVEPRPLFPVVSDAQQKAR